MSGPPPIFPSQSSQSSSSGATRPPKTLPPTPGDSRSFFPNPDPNRVVYSPEPNRISYPPTEGNRGYPPAGNRFSCPDPSRLSFMEGQGSGFTQIFSGKKDISEVINCMGDTETECFTLGITTELLENDNAVLGEIVALNKPVDIRFFEDQLAETQKYLQAQFEEVHKALEENIQSLMNTRQFYMQDNDELRTKLNAKIAEASTIIHARDFQLTVRKPNGSPAAPTGREEFERKPNVSPPAPAGRYECPYCHKGILEGQFDAHIRQCSEISHDEPEPSTSPKKEDTKSARFIGYCPYCNREFPESELDEHVKQCYVTNK